MADKPKPPVAAKKKVHQRTHERVVLAPLKPKLKKRVNESTQEEPEYAALKTIRDSEVDRPYEPLSVSTREQPKSSEPKRAPEIHYANTGSARRQLLATGSNERKDEKDYTDEPPVEAKSTAEKEIVKSAPEVHYANTGSACFNTKSARCDLPATGSDEKKDEEDYRIEPQMEAKSTAEEEVVKFEKSAQLRCQLDYWKVFLVAAMCVAVLLMIVLFLLTLAVVGLSRADDNTERYQELQHTAEQMAEQISALKKQLNMTIVTFQTTFSSISNDLSQLGTELNSVTHDLSQEVNSVTHNLSQELNSVTHDLSQELNSVTHDLSQEVNSVTHDLSQELNSVTHDLSQELNSVTHNLNQLITKVNNVSFTVDTGSASTQQTLDRHTIDIQTLNASTDQLQMTTEILRTNASENHALLIADIGILESNLTDLQRMMTLNTLSTTMLNNTLMQHIVPLNCRTEVNESTSNPSNNNTISVSTPGYIYDLGSQNVSTIMIIKV